MKLEPYRDEELPGRFQLWLERLRSALRPVPAFHFGSGTPEAVVDGIEGDRYYNRTGGAGTRLYVKTTNTGNTGWVAYG